MTVFADMVCVRQTEFSEPDRVHDGRGGRFDVCSEDMVFERFQESREVQHLCVVGKRGQLDERKAQSTSSHLLRFQVGYLAWTRSSWHGGMCNGRQEVIENT